MFYLIIMQLEFEGKIGFSPESDIAIDDVFIDHGKCPAGFHSMLCLISLLVMHSYISIDLFEVAVYYIK